MKYTRSLLLLICAFFSWQNISSQTSAPDLHYQVFLDKANAHLFHMKFSVANYDKDTLLFKLPAWMPGYYQLMNYAKNLENLEASYPDGQKIPIKKVNDNSWQLILQNQKPFTLNYDIRTQRQFVATSYIDSTHAYLVPGNNFLYIDGQLNTSVRVEVMPNPKGWKEVATGLTSVGLKANLFEAPNFDILYDCPILVGDLEELPAFEVNGVVHRFIGYKLGEFDRELFMEKLKKVVEAAVSIIGDIPFEEYTFIAIGPGRGGIEHLNNTTVSFDGNRLKDSQAMLGMLNFLAHEYFHHYNVKRIRPYELGPFNYDGPTRTQQLWISEGLTVYYEYLITKIAGLADERAFFSFFENHINHVENNPGRLNQSLAQASYYTWEDGPFGRAGETISVYQKGPLVGLLLDFAIRHATQNEKSLDDVMRHLYNHFYKNLHRGFTESEFQASCEQIAGQPLADVFTFIYTTQELDYNSYLAYAGLELAKTKDEKGKASYTINKKPEMNALQSAILQSWLHE